jgi:hypothetical protein
LKPIITIYSGGTPTQTKKFDGFMEAAFWIGLEQSDGDLESVKVRQPSESYDTDVANLLEFSSLMVKRQINFSIEFFEEPPQVENPEQSLMKEPSADLETPSPVPAEDSDHRAELEKLKGDYDKGLMTKRQYEARKASLLKKWRQDLEGRLSR